MSGGVDRRTFLRRAGLVAGGAVAAGVTAADQELEALTRPVVADVSAAPWRLP